MIDCQYDTPVTSTMRTTALLLVTLFLSLVAPVPLRARGCQNWWEGLAQSFLPRQPDENSLKKLISETPQQYHSSISQEERQHWAERIGASVIDDPDTERRLQAALTRFYDAGEQLYGVRLNPTDVAIVNKADANAFATGSLVFLHEGLLRYYLDPVQYLSQTGQSPQSLAPEQYDLLTNTFNWRDDWNSIYYALAHEASHNIMGHRDQEVLGAVQQMLADYRQQVTDRRKNLAVGKSGIGTRRYLWRSTSRFLDSFNQSERHREMESEADLVALTLLQQSGMDPQIALIGAQRLAMLVGYGVPEGFQASMTYSLCSTHPDWIARLDAMQTNLSCMQSTGHLCQEHVPYPVDTTLPALKEALSKVQSYDAETLRFAGGDSSLPNGVTYDVLIDVNPNDAELKIDGNDVSSSSVQLLVGPHKLVAKKPTYQQQSISFVVFPDVKSQLKLKLKKQ
jgi:Zn-dependent protease with chaperone function